MRTKEDILKKINTDFKPQYFNNSAIEDFLKSSESRLILVLRSSENTKQYENFDNDFSKYLEKLPDSNLKKTVGFLFNKKLVYYGATKNVEGTTYVRLMISKNEKLAGVVLNAYALDISIKDGTTPQMDEAVYTAYYGLIRAATIINKEEVKKDHDLQKLLSSFLYVLMLKILGRNISVTPHQKTLLQLICTYLFYRQFMEEKHIRVVKIILKDYTDLFTKETLENFESYLEKFSPFNSFKDFPRIIQMFSIADVNPSQLTMSIIRAIGSNGFHTLLGTLDNLAATIVLAKYPTEIVGRGFSINSELQEKVENQLLKYINKISYEDDFNRFTEKNKGENKNG